MWGHPMCPIFESKLNILRPRTRCPALEESARETGWVMDGPAPLLAAGAIISYLSCNGSVVPRPGLVLLGSE